MSAFDWLAVVAVVVCGVMGTACLTLATKLWIHRCGRFVGIGGFYDALPEDTEEGYSACAEHAKKFNPATGEQGEGR